MPVQYENAPITEALIDIRIDAPAAATLDVLEALYEEVRQHYPVKRRTFQIQGQFSGGDQVGAAAKQSVVGFSLESEDRRQIFQARFDGFTFSRLRPYGNWSELRDEAKRLWRLYYSAVKPERITRVAVRYVNRIDIPAQTFDFKDYFRTAPEVSSALSQDLSDFFMRLQFPQPDFGGLLTLTQAVAPVSHTEMNSVILDLDVFKAGAAMTSDDEAWELLETLRSRKNEYFEGSITDKTRALFGWRKEY